MEICVVSSVQPEDHIDDAMVLLIANWIRGLPVIEENGKLVGIISEGNWGELIG